jgi:hypothetical protein
MKYEHSIAIDAPPAIAWDIISDVGRWPEWTASVTRVERFDSGPLSAGSRARVVQPKLPVMTWTVTELEPGRLFTWTARQMGNSHLAYHRIIPDGTGCRAVLGIESSGLGIALMGWMFKKRGQRYVEMEGAGLKARAEARARGQGA